MECRCLKLIWLTWVLKTHVIAKEGLGVKLPIWLSTTKSWVSPWFLCFQVACDISMKSSWQGLQLFFRPQLNWRSERKRYGPPKSQESQFQEFQDSQVGNLGTKWHLGASPMVKHREHYKGEGGGFPKSMPGLILWVHVCLWLICAPTMH